MLLGIDVGGTHTDAVVIDGSAIVTAAKVTTDHDNLLSSVRASLRKVLADVDPAGVTRLNLSTTLSTNSIVEGKSEDVGVLVSAGPGIDPENQRIGRHYYVIPGSIDHRGTVIQALDDELLAAAIDECKKHGVRVFATVCKFSTRNPDHEKAMASALGDDVDFITRGHLMSGVLNFPRRVATAYFNSSVWRVYNDFAWAVEESAAEFGLKADINILKADGGTMPIAASKDEPVESILSGPAASVMGIIALCNITEDSIILDVGGTTTDIAVFADGAPVIEKDGMTVGSYPTLVRALKVRSIGIGGDSALHYFSNNVQVGPDRKGPPLSVCELETGKPGTGPALTDVMNCMGITRFGNVDASTAGVCKLAEIWGVAPEDLCHQALDYSVKKIGKAALELVDEINEKPVYTIHELLKGKKIEPRRIYIMGGPAQALAERLEAEFGLPVVVPEHYSYANAVGAALTKTTMEILLFADTGKRRLIIPRLNVNEAIDKKYKIEQAKLDVVNYLKKYMETIGVSDMDEPEVTEAESFTVVEGPVASGRNIRVRCQIRPGVARVDNPEPPA